MIIVLTSKIVYEVIIVLKFFIFCEILPTFAMIL